MIRRGAHATTLMMPHPPWAAVRRQRSMCAITNAHSGRIVVAGQAGFSVGLISIASRKRAVGWYKPLNLCHIRNMLRKSARTTPDLSISSLRRRTARLWSDLRKAGNCGSCCPAGAPLGWDYPERRNLHGDLGKLRQERTGPIGPNWRSGHENENVTFGLRSCIRCWRRCPGSGPVSPIWC